jgi:hypothetical protein
MRIEASVTRLDAAAFLAGSRGAVVTNIQTITTRLA